ncbi:aspartyl-phosphate phosphatase Spo0E family protein [Alkalihalobacillus deserti]|uniref:aspartyl-phosphate phosphatase Spo0E family protein n=1 Tax=Alkalihalobacillus deserti TaxID=2879466 RepID=UPI001D157C2C|nr:aspartyl-phosphate phosphatase Spo0E family protein [Alkalihalobacillus deserti]
MTATVMKLKNKIEEKKMEMINIAKRKGMASPETLHCSQELDNLIYKFQSLSFVIHKQGKTPI